MRTIWVTLVLLLGLGVGIGNADTFNLTTGESVIGDLLVTSANDAGVQIKVGEGDYKRVSWGSFSQEDLKKMLQVTKLQQYVEPFIEVTVEERIQRTEPNAVPPPRLNLPPNRSLLGAMFSSSLGVFILLALYAANLYAGYEVAAYRGKPVATVCGVSAVLPFLGPIIFLAMPTNLRPSERESEESTTASTPATTDGKTGSPTAPAAATPGFSAGRATAAPVASAALTEDDNNTMHVAGVEHPEHLHLAHEEAPAKPKHPPATVYQRGQFTFNRRFFETRFPGFFGVVRRDAEKDMVLAIKAARGEYVGTRISRIASNDLHLQVQKGSASEEVMIPFSEIQEIRHKHKDD